MTALVERLTEETRTRLRATSAAAEELDWPAEVARREGWLIANQRYHAAQRAQGAAEMAALLEVLGLEPPFSPDQIADVLLAAIEIYLMTDGITAEAQVREGGVHLTVSRCPIYDRFTDPTWRGVTACGCFARRLGWYDALGIPADEELISNRKWDDPVCQTSIHLPLPVV